MSRYTISSTLSIQSSTWNKKSHNLYDYESNSITKKYLKVTSNSKLIQLDNSNNIHVVSDHIKDQIDFKKANTLAYIKYENGIFTIYNQNYHGHNNNNGNLDNNVNNQSIFCPSIANNTQQQQQQHIWFVVKSFNKSYGHGLYKLTSGDIIKLGRSIYRVKEVVTDLFNDLFKNKHDITATTNYCIPDPSIDYKKCFITENKPLQEKNEESSGLICRICLSNETFEEKGKLNYLISPCGCSGSVKYVHINCLQQWIISKREITLGADFISYSWKSISCELCHQDLPDVFIGKGQQIDLFKVPCPLNNYIILEDINKNKNFMKKFYVIHYQANQKISIGRGTNNNICSEDISVSRIHAFIKMENGQFYLADNNSRYGTLVLFKENALILNHIYNPMIQIGSTIMSLEIIQKEKQPTKPTIDLAGINMINNQKYSRENDDNDRKLGSFQSVIDFVNPPSLDIDPLEFMISKKQHLNNEDHINIFDQIEPKTMNLD